MPPVSIQDRLFPDLPCFGCGPANAEGLQLKSFPAADGDGVVATFRPWPQHDNGVGFLNGGIIATLLDCHSAAAVLTEADDRGWRPIGTAPLAYLTAGLDVRYLRPAPLDEPLELGARVTTAEEAQMTCAVELVFDGKIRASAEALWKRWRPRTP